MLPTDVAMPNGVTKLAMIHSKVVDRETPVDATEREIPLGSRCGDDIWGS